MGLMALLILGGLGVLATMKNSAKRTEGDLVRQPISRFAAKSHAIKRCWAKPCTIQAHATGKKQPSTTGPKQHSRTFGTEINNLEARVQSTSFPEWKMRFQRARDRMGAQLARNENPNCNQGRLADRYTPFVTTGDEKWHPASNWTRVAATYQKRYTNTGIFSSGGRQQPQVIHQHTKGIGQPNRKVNCQEDHTRVVTVNGAWPKVQHG